MNKSPPGKISVHKFVKAVLESSHQHDCLGIEMYLFEKYHGKLNKITHNTN